MTQALAGVLLVLLCAIIEGFAQLFLKKSALTPAARKRWIAAGIAFFILQALIYTVALRLVEVSTAFPMGSVAYVVVAVFSRSMLDEQVTRIRWLGVGLIMLGVTLLGAQA